MKKSTLIFFFSNQTNISKSPIPLTVINKNKWVEQKKKKGGVLILFIRIMALLDNFNPISQRKMH